MMMKRGVQCRILLRAKDSDAIISIANYNRPTPEAEAYYRLVSFFLLSFHEI